ncbi:hypothetical protein C9374_007409 [Naegleria lovaniensis]|uniref:Uncharacterized protein n=1 Tax=Naegleria lovaniensis TaxID=51637 RepID=A0AA88KH72_NAELO|nr:uncharacterized protein C9374_007409 [Naegleria lovaniensis]KAG2379270.1 hypothetical protein C9374_007409 [Naegleria lovaniensis]
MTLRPHNTRLFTKGFNTDGQLGLSADVKRATEFTEVTQLLEMSEEESRKTLSLIDKVAVGRSSLMFSTTNNRVLVCGMNTYNQIGLEHETPKFLFRPIEDLLKKELQHAKKMELALLENKLGTMKVNEKTRTFLLEKLNKKFEKIHSIDKIGCGWFHSMIVLNNNLVFGSGHSYFGQLFGKPQTHTFQYLNNEKFNPLQLTESMIQNIENGNFNVDPFNINKVTHLDCGTFSTSIVMNNCQLYACGEVIGATATEDTYLMEISKEFNENCQIVDVFHTDSGIAIHTSNSEIIIIEREKLTTPKRISNIVRCIGGHMCSDLYYAEAASPHILKKWTQTDGSLNFNISKCSLPCKLYSGYYHVFLVSEDKYIYTDSSFSNSIEDDYDENTDSITLSGLITPSTKTSDKGNGLLAKYLLHDQYKVADLGSGSDVSFVLISWNSSREEEETKARMLKQTKKSGHRAFSDISLKAIDHLYYH